MDRMGAYAPPAPANFPPLPRMSNQPRPLWMNEPGLEPQYPIEEALIGGRLGELGVEVAGKVLNKFGDRVYRKFYNSQMKHVKDRAARLLAQKDKWRFQSNTLEDELMTATKRHSIDNGPGGNMHWKTDSGIGNTEVSYKELRHDPRRAGQVARHEVGHYYNNMPSEEFEWKAMMDRKKSLASVPQGNDPEIIDDYLFLRHGGNEIRERAAQLKDFIAEKRGIPMSQDFEVTKEDVDWALKNYLKKNYDNTMTPFINGIVDKDLLHLNMNRYALGATPFIYNGGSRFEKRR